MPELKTEYPLVIIGAGPAGLSASIYASRYRVENLIIGQSLGGLLLEAHKVGNFPSEIEISGFELADKMQQHVEALGAPILAEMAADVARVDDKFKIITDGGREIYARAILLATGTKHRKLELLNEEKYLGKGISYCATCDGMFFRNKIVAVIGGANSAINSATYLAEVADKVYMIIREDKLSGEQLLIDKILSNKKIEVIFNAQVKEIGGGEFLEKIILDKDYNGQPEIKVDGLFIEIGTLPQRYLIDKLQLAVDDLGRVKVGRDQKTNQAGVWAAGDITDGSNNFRQIITAASEGSIAAENIFRFLQENK
jgi:thioredoxin reductase (NADPH)